MPAAARGRPPGSRVKPWEDALRLCALRKGKDGKTELLKIAEATIEAAKTGDMEAVKEIGNRLDGKAVQQTDLNIDASADFVGHLAGAWARMKGGANAA